WSARGARMSLTVAMRSGVSRLDDAGFLFSPWNGLRSAREYGSTLFEVVDAQEDEPLPQNVVRLRFRENEGAYLAGLVAARSSRTGKVGFVGGVEIPVVERFDTGFREGVARVEGVRVIREVAEVQLKAIGFDIDQSFLAPGTAVPQPIALSLRTRSSVGGWVRKIEFVLFRLWGTGRRIERNRVGWSSFSRARARP
ncbi:MAG: BMP family ABC transporter substrate-binding protein, partial [Alkalispirochaetaceae bacterium]